MRLGSRARIPGTLTQIDPRASTQLIHPALAATEGGPLAVTQPDQRESEIQLAEPHFRAVVALTEGASHELNSGERGYAVMGWQRERLGTQLLRWITDWIDDKVQQIKDER